MKKGLAFVFFCLGVSIIASDTVDTTDIRKYHQQLEERVFELEEDEEKDYKIKEAFLHGKRRITDAVKNEKVVLEAEEKETSKKLEELKVLEEKYNKVIDEYEKLSLEKKKLIEENKVYLEELKKIEENSKERR